MLTMNLSSAFLLFITVCFSAFIICESILFLHVTKKPKLFVSQEGGTNVSCVSALSCYKSCMASDHCLSANVYRSNEADNEGTSAENRASQCTCEMFSDVILSDDQLVNATQGQFYMKPGEIRSILLEPGAVGSILLETR